MNTVYILVRTNHTVLVHIQIIRPIEVSTNSTTILFTRTLFDGKS